MAASLYPHFEKVIDQWEISQYGPREFYAFRYVTDPNAVPQLIHITDSNGMDQVFESREAALEAIEKERLAA